MIVLLQLIATLLIAVIIPMVLVIYILGKGEIFRARFNSAFALDTGEGLIRQGLLWLAISIPLMIGLALGVWAWGGYGVLLNAAGYETFFKISLLPLGVMSISLPLAGLVSRIHSTQQAARQIRQAEKQIEINSFKSNLDAFYAHRRGFSEYFSGIPDTEYFNTLSFSYKAHPVVHKRFFEGSPEQGWPAVNKKYFASVEREILGAARFLEIALTDDPASSISTPDAYLNACTSIYHAARALGIKKIYHDLVQEGVTVKANDKGDLVSIGVTTLEVLAAIRFVREFFNNLCDYAGVQRMKVSGALDVVFTKTERYAKIKAVEYLHAVHIQRLIDSGAGSVNEKHPNYRG